MMIIQTLRNMLLRIVDTSVRATRGGRPSHATQEPPWPPCQLWAQGTGPDSAGARSWEPTLPHLLLSVAPGASLASASPGSPGACLKQESEPHPSPVVSKCAF